VRNLSKVLLGIAVVVTLGLGFFFILLYRTISVPADANHDTTYHFTIEPGMTSSSINEALADQGLIRNALLANMVVRLMDWSHIQAGEYGLSPALSLKEMYEKFQEGLEKEALHRITIPEGEDLAFITSVMAPITDLTAEELLEHWREKSMLQNLIEDYWFLTDSILNEGVKHPLEGYIYPITYDFREETYEVEVLTRELLNMTERRLEPLRELIEENTLSIHEIMTLASIIEGETANPNEMPIVSGVFYNRLDIEMMLQSCATIQYILEERVIHVTHEMTRIESPYNTYNILGLPISPIGNPSIAAIQATLQPQENEYLYFIGDIFNCVDGQTHFFTTFEEHQAFYEAYLLPSYNAGESVCQ